MKSYREIAGDGGSRVVEQVGEQRQAIARALAGVRHLVAVASGKGGVGKSTVTFALAQGLLAQGWRVAILDADLNGPCQAQMAGLDGVPWVPGEDGLAVPRRPDGLGVVSLGSLLPPGDALRFAQVSRGDEQVWRATREITLLGQLLAAVSWGRLDALLVDLPPGPERTLQMSQFLGPQAAFVLVTVPSAVARRVVARSLDALAGHGSRVLGYVENMAGYLCRDCGRVRPLFPDPGEPLPLPRLARLPFDPELAALCDRGWPPAGAGAAHGAAALGADAARSLITALEATA